MLHSQELEFDKTQLKGFIDFCKVIEKFYTKKNVIKYIYVINIGLHLP